MLNLSGLSGKARLERRVFLSRSAVVGGLALIGSSLGSVTATRPLLAKKSDVVPKNNTAPTVGNATVTDFAPLLGERFYLRTEGGTVTSVRLIEANAPKTRHALRFRREHFSIVFDVPDETELVQGHYWIGHPQLGAMALFMVPVDLPAQYHRLEAVFT